jgi:hypothetical protein
MRSSDVIGARVYDKAGRDIGKVHDIRAARDGRHEVEAPYVASHLLVAAGSVGTRLGYGYGHMHGPWPLSTVMDRAMARSYAVRWDQIASIESKHELRLSAARDELMTMAELIGGDEA